MRTTITPDNKPTVDSFVSAHYHNGLHRNGSTTIFGTVTQAGPKTFTVRWESGATNRRAYANAGGISLTTYDAVDIWARHRLGRYVLDMRAQEEFEYLTVRA